MSFLLVSAAGSAAVSLTKWEQTRGVGNYGFMVPHPTDPVPSDIMTGQNAGWPTGADLTSHEWVGTYDPTTVSAPEPTVGGAADEWYVNPDTGDDGTAGQGGQGTDAAPRETFPDGTISAGDKIFIDGTGTLGTGVSDNRTLTFEGTSSDPCWVVYVGSNARATMSFDEFTIRGTHWIFQDIAWNMAATDQTDGSVNVTSTATVECEYGAFRGCRVYSDGTDVGAESGLIISGDSANPVDFVVVCSSPSNDTEVEDLGSYTGPNNNDYHGLRPVEYCRHLWFVDCQVTRCGGDGMQVADSGWGDGNEARRCHYVYVLGGDWTLFGEQGIDLKNCFHVFIEDIEGHDNTSSLPSGGAPGTVNFNNDEGDRTNGHYVYRSKLTNDGIGVLDQGDQVDQHSAAIACIFDDCAIGLQFSGNNNGTGDKLKHAIDCTFYSCSSQAINEGYAGAEGHTYIHGCIFYDNAEELNTGGAEYRECVNVVADRVSGSASLASGLFDVYTNVTLDTDPLLSDPANDDFTLTSDSSPCHQANTEHSIYQLLEDRYGVDCRYDYYGNPRPAVSGDWDIGHHQRS